MPFAPGHTLSRKPKLFDRALRVELAAMGDDFKGLREIARAQIAKAMAGELKSAEFIVDRIDGKVAQAIHHGQDEDAEGIRIAYDDRDIVRRLAFMMLAPPEKVEDIP